jgi:UDP-glucose 6-dehydrogenase
MPPATEAIIPDSGGASEAIANPKPNGKAISDTTNPEKIFFGNADKNETTPVCLPI